MTGARMVNPTEALDLKRKLSNWLMNEQAGVEYLRIIVDAASWEDKLPDGSPALEVFSDVAPADRRAAWFGATINSQLQGSTYVITEERYNEALRAAATVSARALLASDLPTDRGIVFFPVGVDIPGDLIPFGQEHDAVGWAVSWNVFRAINDVKDIAVGFGWHLVNYDHQLMQPLHIVMCRLDSDAILGEGESASFGVPILIATLGLMRQPRTEATREIPSREARREARAQGLVDLSISVIRLRPLPAEEDLDAGPREPGAPRPIDWRVRWTVTEHDRRIRDRATGGYRTIKIRSYTKGPQDKPLKDPAGKVYIIGNSKKDS